MISTRSAGLLIDTVVCLTLAKWETVSGRFGGYLTATFEIVSRRGDRVRSLDYDQPRPTTVSLRGSLR
jgi:hypothetical protein